MPSTQCQLLLHCTAYYVNSVYLFICLTRADLLVLDDKTNDSSAHI